MRLVDWRDPAVPALTPVWRRELDRWQRQLAWDSRATWDLVERQRIAGRLAGLVLLDDSRVAGWTFFLVRHNLLQIGGIGAGSIAATRALVDAIVSVAEPDLAPDGVMLFCFSDAPGLDQALATHGFEREAYLYLVRPTAAAVQPEVAADLQVRNWQKTTAADVPRLLSRAYAEPSLTRPFVRHESPLEWQEYVAQLVEWNACGQFAPELSAACTSDDGTLEGVVLTTLVHERTAHVAQVGIDPRRQGQGIAEAMLRAVIARAEASGCERTTLLVGERNARARRLYARLGFRQAARFMSAGRGPRPYAASGCGTAFTSA